MSTGQTAVALSMLACACASHTSRNAWLPEALGAVDRSTVALGASICAVIGPGSNGPRILVNPPSSADKVVRMTTQSGNTRLAVVDHGETAFSVSCGLRNELVEMAVGDSVTVRKAGRQLYEVSRSGDNRVLDIGARPSISGGQWANATCLSELGESYVDVHCSPYWSKTAFAGRATEIRPSDDADSAGVNPGSQVELEVGVRRGTLRVTLLPGL